MRPSARNALPALALLGAPSAFAADFQNVLIIIADDVGVDKVGSYAGDVVNPTETRPVTPNVDVLSAAGVRFTDAWATPVCSPSRAMLLSGEVPYRNGIGVAILEASSRKLAFDPDTLQQLATDAGVATGMFGKWHLGEGGSTPDAATSSPLNYADYPIVTGFSWFEGNTDGAIGSYTNWLYMRSVPNAAMSSGYETTAVDVTTATVSDQTTDDAIAWMTDQSAAGERFFTLVSYNLAHSIRESWADPAASCVWTGSGTETEMFEFSVECLDTEIGELIAGTPDLQNTLVIFFGDNGTEQAVAEGEFEQGRGKGTVYEGGVRVPLLVVDGAALQDTLDNGGTLPSSGVYTIDAGVEANDPGTVVDLYATVADLLDLTSSTCTVGSTCGEDSLTLRSVLTGGAPIRDYVWTERFDAAGRSAYTGSGAIRSGDMKLLIMYSIAGQCLDYEMYDVAADRWEATDLLDDPAYSADQAALFALLADEAVGVAASGNNWLDYPDCDRCAATETWYNGVDDDCSGGSDYDQDGDGLDATAYGGSDCNDTNASILPGAPDTWYDGVDSNCDGHDDYDQDNDTYTSSTYGGTDCNDTANGVHPGASDTWYDGVDTNCDGRNDYDKDNDTYPSSSYGGTDCNDNKRTINPGARETWYDGVDSNCDGRNDYDKDGDGYRSSSYGGTDCNDSNRNVYPGRGC